MNIAEITTYKEGGVYTHVVDLVKGMNVKSLVVTGNTKKSGYQTEEGVTFFHIPAIFSPWMIYFINPAGSYRKVIHVLKENHINLVHFHNPLFTFSNKIIKKHDYPLVMTAHYVIDLKGNRAIAAIYKAVIKLTTQWIAKNVDRIICVNHDYLQIFTSWGVDRKKLVFIPNGVNTDRFCPGESSIKVQYNDQKLIIFFGRLHYQKNVDLLIQSFSHLKSKNVKLIIIGDGPDSDRLRKMSQGNKDIIMTGRVSDDMLLEYLRAADLMVLPSRGETASLTMMEAMACGIPVIASNVGNAKEMLGEGRGVLFEKYTEEELAEKCDMILEDSKHAKEIGKKAMIFVHKYYSLKNTCQKTEALYNEIMTQQEGSS